MKNFSCIYSENYVPCFDWISFFWTEDSMQSKLSFLSPALPWSDRNGYVLLLTEFRPTETWKTAWYFLPNTSPTANPPTSWTTRVAYQRQGEAGGGRVWAAGRQLERRGIYWKYIIQQLMSYNSLPRTSCAPLSAVALFITTKMQKQTKGHFTDK